MTAPAAIRVFSAGQVIPHLHMRVPTTLALASSDCMGSHKAAQSDCVRKVCTSRHNCWHRAGPLR
eukprot:715925-Pyramimonas_sp.AAC.1